MSASLNSGGGTWDHRRMSAMRNSLRAVCLLALLAGTARADDVAQLTPSPSDNSAPGDSPAPVSFRGNVLFELRSGIGELDARARAEAVQTRLVRALAGADPSAPLRIVEREDSSDIYAGEQLIASVTTSDAAPLGRTRAQLAADYRTVLQGAIATEMRERSARGLLIAAIQALTASVVLALLLWLLGRGYNGVRSAIRGWLERMIGRARKDRGLATNVLEDIVVAATRSALFIAIVAAIFVYVEFCLSRFPWTRAAGLRLGAAAISALRTVGDAIFAYVPNIFVIALIVVVVRYLLKIVRAAFIRVATGRIRFASFYPEWAQPTYSIVRFALLAIGAVMIFPYLPGAGSEGFRSVSVFVGVLLSLGAASAVANVIAGLVVTYMRPFQVGDRVKIADTIGDVVAKDLFVVRVRTIKNVEITVPNALVLANHIVNFSATAAAEGLILHTTVTIGYDVDWRKVHAALLDAARRVESLLDDPAPYVLQTALNDFYVSYELNAYTREPARMAQIYSELHAHIQDCCNEAGIEIMSPHYSAIRDGNASAIPTQYLPQNYAAPAFQFFAAPSASATGTRSTSSAPSGT
ncbi:MAG: mechanosensitive ion channel family protein [Steroidobacteraceae bacterium]